MVFTEILKKYFPYFSIKNNYVGILFKAYAPHSLRIILENFAFELRLKIAICSRTFLAVSCIKQLSRHAVHTERM